MDILCPYSLSLRRIFGGVARGNVASLSQDRGE